MSSADASSAETSVTYTADGPTTEEEIAAATALVPPEGLSDASFGSGNNAWWGTLLLILILGTVFAGVIGSYFYLFANATVWPPDGVGTPDMLLPVISTVLLLATLIPAWIADRGIAAGNVNTLRVSYIIGAIMLAVYLGLKVYEYATLDIMWDDHAYGSIVWLVGGSHALGVLAVLIMVVVLLILAFMGFFRQDRRAAIQSSTLFWAFFVFAWIPMFATVYLFPNYV